MCKRNNHYLLTDDSLLSVGIKMAAGPVEDNCISLVEMKFIDNTLYFVGKSEAIGQIQGSDKYIELEGGWGKLLSDSFLSPNSIVILMTLFSGEKK